MTYKIKTPCFTFLIPETDKVEGLEKKVIPLKTKLEFWSSAVLNELMLITQSILYCTEGIHFKRVPTVPYESLAYLKITDNKDPFYKKLLNMAFYFITKEEIYRQGKNKKRQNDDTAKI
ncbi:MAG: hypothetical protein QXP53_02465 [Candidatus Pacearchaeota archaeon]